MSVPPSAASSPPSSATPSSPEAAALPSGAVRLSDWGVMRARGDDAKSFLHSQLTNDIQHLDAAHARLAGYCSPKGRLLASFVVWQGGDGAVLLACSAELLAATLERLSRFVLRARCRLDDATAELPLWGLAGTEAMAARGAPASAWRRLQADGGDLITLPPARIDGVEVPRALFAGTPAPPPLPALGTDVWRWLEALSGVPRIVAATAEQFVPQMVNLELAGGVAFDKGCYPGQEVVARSQYRGTLKRRGYVLASEVPLAAGDELFDAADPTQPAGLVALAASHAGRHAALAALKIEAVARGELRAGSAAGPALSVVVPQPYPVPAQPE
ncbi:MAG: folate-binding protein YgfZ [Proteobacteria bacterium]|nr:folate-binding protein YgfZ [Pseudomonadota bacterium]